jgi:hypothetical protein
MEKNYSDYSSLSKNPRSEKQRAKTLKRIMAFSKSYRAKHPFEELHFKN